MTGPEYVPNGENEPRAGDRMIRSGTMYEFVFGQWIPIDDGYRYRDIVQDISGERKVVGKARVDLWPWRRK